MTAARFVWHDLMSTDPEAAKAFYTQLFGWNVKPMDMGEYTYSMLLNGDTDEFGFGGINPLDPAHGMPSHWMCYLNMPDGIDAGVAKITELGGTIVEQPFDIPGVGKMAVAADPQGAYFAPFESVPPQDPTPPPLPTPNGGVTWHELTTTDVEAATAFYTGITELSKAVMDVGTGPYTMLTGEGENDYRAGIFQAPDGMPMSAWIIYYEITQDSLDETLAEVTRLGGQVFMGPMDVPTVGTIAVVADPTGGVIGLMKSAPMG
jgi:predicted enzyme related to lactoylglutathione lyase